LPSASRGRHDRSTIGTPLARGDRGSDWRIPFVLIGLGGLVWLAPRWLVKDDRNGGAAGRGDDATNAVPFGHGQPGLNDRRVVLLHVLVYFCMTWMRVNSQRPASLLTRWGVRSSVSACVVATLAGWEPTC
jgi:hypothetical protein